jgi:hypothetical protein
MFFVYLLASKPSGTLYVGVTSDLLRRISEHKNKLIPGLRTNTGWIASSGSRFMRIVRPPFAVRNKSRNGSAIGRSS